jgi:hypothetical protein
MTGNGLEEDDDDDDEGPEGGGVLGEERVGDPPGLAGLAAEAAAFAAGGFVAVAAGAGAAGLPCNWSWLSARFWLEVAADASVRTACEDDAIPCLCIWTRVLITNADGSTLLFEWATDTATAARRR